MVVVLLASVAVAAWLVELRGGPVRDGRQVLDLVRRRGLEAFWGREPETLWYLARDGGGKPAGWWTVRRRPTPSGYRGEHVRRMGEALYQEAWSVDANAQTSEYVAEASQLVQRTGQRMPVLRQESTTRITYRRGRVEVLRRTLHRGRQSAADDAPANYVPEGISSLVYYLTAAGQREAAFALIFNEAAVVGKRVHFSETRVVPEGRRRVHVTYTAAGGVVGEEVVEFDAPGRVVRGRRPGSGRSWKRVSFEAVRKVFPEASQFAEPRREGAGAGAGAGGMTGGAA